MAIRHHKCLVLVQVAFLSRRKNGCIEDSTVELSWVETEVCGDCPKLFAWVDQFFLHLLISLFIIYHY